MLPGPLRLRRSADFTSVMKRGCKVSRPTLVLYARGSAQPRFGLIVGKAVGGAVTRNQVKRRLRHQAAQLIRDGASQPMDVVVRALPRAAADKRGLAEDLGTAWARARRAEYAEQTWRGGHAEPDRRAEAQTESSAGAVAP